MSLPQLSNFQIEQGNDDNPSFGGCFSRDNLPTPLAQKYYIVNLDSQSGPGSHWCLLDNRRSDECMWCDSFGFPPPQEVLEKMNATHKNLVYNDVDVQAIGSEACGWWSEYFADKLGEGHSFRQVVGFAEKQPNPDAYLKTVYQEPIAGHPFEFKKKEFLQSQLSQGGGVFDFVNNRLHFKPRKHATKRFKNFLGATGNQKVVKMEVGRTPVVGAVQSFLNTISLGGYEKKKKKLNYQNVFHNYLIITLANGDKYRIEKNHVIEASLVKSNTSHKYDELLYDIPVDEKVTVNSLIQNAEKDNEKFWQYNPRDNNCQIFVRDLIHKSHLEPDDEDTKHIIKPQDGNQLIESLPKPLQSLPNKITHLAAVGDRVIHGDGIPKPKRRRVK
jgi:hypothetical protein